MCNCKDCKGITLLKGTGIETITNNGDGTFTILLTNGETYTTDDFTGPQGPQGIQGPAGTNGTNGTNGTDGVGIDHIYWASNSGGQPQGTQGTTDTYTISLTDASTYDFLVTNGANGASGTTITWITRTNTDPASYIIPTSNTAIVNQYDLTAFSEYTLPNSGLSIGDSIEIIDNKTSFPSQTRILCPVGHSIFFSGLGSTTTRIECPGDINTVIKLVYVATNTWAISNYISDNGFGITYPVFI